MKSSLSLKASSVIELLLVLAFVAMLAGLSLPALLPS